MKILIAEDDPAARRLLSKFLTARSFDVVEAEDGREAFHRFVSDDPDLVLLDVNMPHMDGWAVLKQIRSLNSTPVIMLTVRDSTADKVKGLGEGADDYVTKPFDLTEIEARVRAVMRRTGWEAPKRVRIGPLSIDDEAKEVRVYGETVNLSPKEYELIRLLASRPGRVFSASEILEAVWPERADEGSTEDVKKYVYFLRGKLEKDPENPVLIQTVRGFGYKLAGSPSEE